MKITRMFLEMTRIILVIQSMDIILRVVSFDTVHKFITFNTALIQQLPFIDQRRDVLSKQLSKIDADVVCLQEVLYFKHVLFNNYRQSEIKLFLHDKFVLLGSDVEKIVNELKTVYPHSYSKLHGQDGQIDKYTIVQPPCYGLPSYVRIVCIVIRCNIRGQLEDIVNCADQKCNVFPTLSQECISCLGHAFPSFGRIFRGCFRFSTTFFNPQGLILLSKKPMRNTIHQPFLPNKKQIFSRSLISADIDSIGSVICTHLTHDQSTPYFEPITKGTFSSWAEENASEVQYIIDFNKSKARFIVMGDLNNGPAIPNKNIAAHFEGSYNKLIGSGMQSPYVEITGKPSFAGTSAIIDHVMHKGYTAINSRRIFDDDKLVNGGPLSDHYGVEVWLK
ncbi:uncharacterized protein LOC127727688 [Mytilus californianus]|uniref:uncharacterized protein LOC127727688 n=1 Tax=Mytilus californianus TaxID=6549 RepID=UPI002245B495|nr:uncharacterized protein LOC127727688 [Mytilus californianus]